MQPITAFHVAITESQIWSGRASPRGKQLRANRLNDVTILTPSAAIAAEWGE